MDRKTRHDIGYWMSVLGFAVVVSGGLFGSFIRMEVGEVLAIVGLGFLTFLLGAEMALRNGKQEHPVHHSD